MFLFGRCRTYFKILLPFKEYNWKILEDLDASLPEELGIGPGSISNSDNLTNGETADETHSTSNLQQILQSNASLSNSANSISSGAVTTASVSSPNSPLLTTLTPVKSPAMTNAMPSPPQMPISTSGTPTPATPLTSSSASDLYLSAVGSVGLSPAPPQSVAMSLSTMNSPFNYGPEQYSANNAIDMNLLANSRSMMGSVNGPSSGMTLNSIARGTGPPYNRTISMNNAPAVPFPTSMPNLQDQLQTHNFLAHAGMNGTDQSRALPSSQVGLLASLQI